MCVCVCLFVFSVLEGQGVGKNSVFRDNLIIL